MLNSLSSTEERECFQNIVDKADDAEGRANTQLDLLLLLLTFTSRDYKDHVRWRRGDTLKPHRGEREERNFLYRYIHKSMHSYPNKLKNKRDRVAGREANAMIKEFKKKKKKKSRQHTVTLSPRSSNKYPNLGSQGKLCGFHTHLCS